MLFRSIDPFANFKIRFKKTDRGYLTQQEINVIMQKKFSSERLERVRDIFIFSCFRGLAYIDVKNLRHSNIRTSFDDGLCIMPGLRIMISHFRNHYQERHELL